MGFTIRMTTKLINLNWNGKFKDGCQHVIKTNRTHHAKSKRLTHQTKPQFLMYPTPPEFRLCFVKEQKEPPWNSSMLTRLVTRNWTTQHILETRLSTRINLTTQISQLRTRLWQWKRQLQLSTLANRHREIQFDRISPKWICNGIPSQQYTWHHGQHRSKNFNMSDDQWKQWQKNEWIMELETMCQLAPKSKTFITISTLTCSTRTS